MRLTKRQLKRIIREEYSRLKRQGLIKESRPQLDLHAEVLSLAGRDEGVSLDELNDVFGPSAFDVVDELCESGACWLDDMEGVVYASDSQPSRGLGPAVDRYTRY